MYSLCFTSSVSKRIAQERRGSQYRSSWVHALMQTCTMSENHIKKKGKQLCSQALAVSCAFKISCNSEEVWHLHIVHAMVNMLCMLLSILFLYTQFCKLAPSKLFNVFNRKWSEAHVKLKLSLSGIGEL